MKKILSFLIASVAVLGLVGCSSDLHDMGDAKIVDRVTKIVGAMNYSGGNVFSDMELVDATTSTYSFTYKTEMSSNWGSPKDGVCFKVGYEVNGWDSCWGQAEDGTTILSGGTGSVKCTKQNGENISFSGLTNGTSYKITAVSGIACVDI